MRRFKILLGVCALGGLMACSRPADQTDQPAGETAQSETSQPEPESREAPQDTGVEEQRAAEDALRAARDAVQNAETTAGEEDKQRQTMKDMERLGKALDRWLADTIGPNGLRTGGVIDTSPEIRVEDYPAISHNELVGMLVPQYIAAVPSTDAWGSPLEIRVRTSDFTTHYLYLIRSPGRDGAFSSDSYVFGKFGARDFDEDIVFNNHSFMRWPESVHVYG